MANSTEHDEFSKRLRHACRHADVAFESPTRLAEDFSALYPEMPVTQQAVRKWLNGEAIPTQAKIQALAIWLGVGPEWLRFGKENNAAHVAQQAFVPYRIAFSENDLMSRYRQLSTIHQQVVSEILITMSKRRKTR